MCHRSLMYSYNNPRVHSCKKGKTRETLSINRFSLSPRMMIATQFQISGARRTFPGFDEPAFKAKFEISIGRWRNQSAISNMPLKDGMEGVPM